MKLTWMGKDELGFGGTHLPADKGNCQYFLAIRTCWAQWGGMTPELHCTLTASFYKQSMKRQGPVCLLVLNTCNGNCEVPAFHVFAVWDVVTSLHSQLMPSIHPHRNNTQKLPLVWLMFCMAHNPWPLPPALIPAPEVHCNFLIDTQQRDMKKCHTRRTAPSNGLSLFKHFFV